MTNQFGQKNYFHSICNIYAELGRIQIENTKKGIGDPTTNEKRLDAVKRCMRISKCYPELYRLEQSSSPTQILKYNKIKYPLRLDFLGIYNIPQPIYDTRKRRLCATFIGGLIYSTLKKS